MCTGLEVIALVGLGLSAFGATEQIKGAEEVEAATRERTKIAKKKAKEEAGRERRSRFRESQIAQAEASNLAGQIGLGESSAKTGAVQAKQQEFNIASGDIGRDLNLFRQTQDTFSAEAQGRGTQAFGAGVSQIGGTLITNANTIGSIFGAVGGTFGTNASNPFVTATST